jgi:hypothetical protein
VNTSIDGGVDSEVESGGLATTQAHVGGAALEALLLAVLGLLLSLLVSLDSILDTLDDIGHGAGAVGAEDLHGVYIGLLGDTVLLASDSAGAVSTVAIAILVSITRRDGLAPVSAALKVDVLDIGASVDDIDINALSAISRVEVLVPGAEAQRVAVRDTSQTPGGILLSLVLVLVLVALLGADDGVLLDVIDLKEALLAVFHRC